MVTFKRHPMDKRLRAPRPRRRRRYVSISSEDVAQAFRGIGKAIKPVMDEIVQPFRQIVVALERGRNDRQIDFVKAR